MAKRKTAARKTTRQTAYAADSHPYRSPATPPSTKARYSKYASVSPSIASSPSPQPFDQLVQRRRKGNPVRSPAQGDVSKGIVFAFRIQNDPDLSMAVDILSYDPALTESTAAAATMSDESESPRTAHTPTTTMATAATTMAKTAATESRSKSTATEAERTVRPASSSSRSSTQADSLKSLSPSSAREQWSNDPSSYLINNVLDLSRNMLILHSRKPLVVGPATTAGSETTLSSPTYTGSSQPSTPPFTDSSSSSSSASSSPASSPGSPPAFSSLVESGGMSTKDDDLCAIEPPSMTQSKPFEGSLPPRMLRVRGLGSQNRTMQVYLV